MTPQYKLEQNSEDTNGGEKSKKNIFFLLLH